MSRDDADSFEWSKPEPAPPADRYKFLDAKGKFTDAGKIALMTFRGECLIPDDENYLAREELERAFSASPEGFPLDDMDDRETFDEFILKRGPHVHVPGTDPTLPSSFVLQLITAREDAYGLTLYGARLVDKLGIEAFDPRDEESTHVEYLVDKLLPLQGVHMFVALPETLKTWLAYHVAIAVSQGRSVLGRFAVKQGRSVIIDFEMGPTELRRRLRLLGADARTFCKSFPPFRLNDESDAFWTELAKIRPRFVVIDGLGAGQSAGVSELDSRFAEPLGRAMRFAHEHGCTILFLHHSPKAASLNDVESFFRGSGAIRSKVDSAFYFHRLPTGPSGETRAEVMPAKSRKGASADAFTIQITDERGVELFETQAEDKPPPLTAEERVHAFIASKPGCSGNLVAGELKIQRETVSELLKGLQAAGRIRVVGKGPTTGYFVVEQTVSPIVSLERSGNDQGNEPCSAAGES